MPRDDDTGRHRVSVLEALGRLSRECDAVRAEAAGEVARAVAAVPGRRAVVLVVEDDESVRRAWTRALRDDCEVLGAGSVDEALRAIDAVRALDVAVIDHMLPDGTGVEVYAHLRLRWPGTRVIVTSGYLDRSGGGVRAAYLVVPGQRPSFHEKPGAVVEDVRRHLPK